MSDSSTLVKVSALCFGSGLAAGFIMSKVVDKLKYSEFEENAPKKWIRVGNISQIYIYPVKSLPGVAVKKAIATKLGFQDVENPNLKDRSFLITNSKGDFQTQRGLPAMALIYPNVQGDVLHLKFVGNKEADLDSDDFSLTFPKDNGTNKKKVRIWTDKVNAIDCGDKVASWLDKVTGSTGLRLFYHDCEISQRKVAVGQRRFPLFRQQDTGTFQDETSYMMMTEESLEEFNSMLKRKLPVRTFRPNLMMTGSDPWSEDVWTFIKIGGDSDDSPVFKTSRPCIRCKMITLDPDTGNEWDDDAGEPLRTLTSLKRPVGDAFVTNMVKNSPVMGNHFGVFKNENKVIQAGDPVFAAIL